MLTDNPPNPPVSEAKHRATFFRQSGWLMIASIAGGMLMWGTHFLAKAQSVPAAEYATFGAFLAVVILLPTIPLQMILAQQTAKALAHHRERELSGVIRLLCFSALGLWLAGCLIVWGLQGTILARLHLSTPVGLWITMLVVLFQLWMPMFQGVLQGQQNFLWLGWTLLISGIGRLSVAAFAVLALHTGSTGMLAGVLLGIVVATAAAAWQCRSLWLARPEPFDWLTLLRQISPLLLGFLGFQILFTADTVFVKSYFDNEAGFYISAGTLSRALMWLVLPLATVMFPRLVHSAVKSEKSNLVGLVLAGTAILAVLGAVSLSVLSPWIVPFVAKKSYVPVACAVLPWYVSAMVPLALANVLLNDLLARPSSKMLLSVSIFGLSLAYLFGLTQFHATLVMMLQTMGVCNLALLGICAWFTWGAPAQRRTARA